VLDVEYPCKNHSFASENLPNCSNAVGLWSYNIWSDVDNLEELPPGPRFVYITFFDVVKNTNFEFRNEIWSISHNFNRQIYWKQQLKFIDQLWGCHDVRVEYKTESANTANPQIAGKG
jgi:hypothetical protein